MTAYKSVDGAKTRGSSAIGLVAFILFLGWLGYSGVIPLNGSASYRTKCNNEPKEFCTAFTNPWGPYENYVSRRSKCKWRVDNRTLIRKHYANSFDYRRYYLHSHFEEYKDRVHVCDEKEDKDGTMLHVQRVGPNVGKGGYDWHIQAYEMDISPVHQAWVTGFMRGPVAMSDERTLGFPPLHMHHYHINYDPGESVLTWRADKGEFNGSIAKRGLFNRVISAHGDQQCSVADGGTACFVEKFPDGYGMKMTRQYLWFNAYVNDVRPAKSDPLRFWLEVGLMATRKKQRTVATMTFISPFEMDFSPNAVLNWDPVTFYIPFKLSDVPSAQWYSCHFSVTGRFLWNYVHMHMVPLNQAIVIKHALAADLGLDDTRFTGDDKGRPWPLPGADATPSFKSWILSNLKELQKSCDEKKCEKRPEIVCELWPNTEFVNGEEFDRRLDATGCSNWEFAKGDKIFVLQFNHAGEYQHAFFRGYWEALDGSDVEHHHSFCSHTGGNQDENGFGVLDIQERDARTFKHPYQD